MKLAYVDLNKYDNPKFGTQTWINCIGAQSRIMDITKNIKEDLSEFDAIIIPFCGGTYGIATQIKQLYPDKKIIGLLDYNSWELHEVLGICNQRGLSDVDIWICPKPLSNWLKVIFKKPVIEAYRPYDPNDFEYVPYGQREKIILVSEHTKTKQLFTEKMVAKRILEQLPDGGEYKIVIKDTCRGDHPYPTGRLEHSTFTQQFNLDFNRIDKWTPAPIPLLSIDHYPAALFGGFHAANAFYGTPTLGVNTSNACAQAFPELVSDQYDLVNMVNKGVWLLTNPDEWCKISTKARDYAINHWSYEAYKQLFDEQIPPLLR